ncbi:TetR/AcrR family transcriptional regulator [Albimonas pacifica]|uniref:Transcriptional regulator, TetR family n=1 Tax=Albimonas pacifica TaxID=1114924 RepID=A0A1I3BXE5_9RHOB|nr:TetR/AcrR family transcriptional regulator [Albimonas pacifica]SFH66985.1 transcriptional regulator, TetR family [Albimonas pacifica]
MSDLDPAQDGPPPAGEGKVGARDRRGRDTRMALILAAERVFAAEGIANTPLRQVAKAAKQRNASVVQYYFDSREALVAAILALRARPADRVRAGMLAAMRAAAGERPLAPEEIARAMVEPMADHLRGERPGHFIRLCSQIWHDRPVWRHVDAGPDARALALCREALAEARPDLPPPLLRQRYGLAFQTQVAGLGRLEQVREATGEGWDAGLAEVQIAAVVDAVTAVLAAPVSVRTLAAMRKAGMG